MYLTKDECAWLTSFAFFFLSAFRRESTPVPDPTPIAGQGNQMRFFNSGVEIAHDGSPVSGTLATLSQPVGIAVAHLSSPSDPDLSASVVGMVEAKEPARGRGLPRFAKGAMLGDGQFAATPSRSWEGASVQGTRNEDFLRCTPLVMYIVFFFQ